MLRSHGNLQSTASTQLRPELGSVFGSCNRQHGAAGSFKPSSRRTAHRQRRTTCMAAKATDVGPGSSGSAGVLDRFYAAVTGFTFPIGPTFSRPTYRYEVVPGQVWMFEQPQKLSGTDVHINIRMTAIRLSSGGLFVYSPIAPTKECVELVREIGNVEHVVLTTHAYEHKLFVGPFARKFPSCKVWSSPGQWSFPLNLPVQFFGIFPEATLQQGQRYPWSDDLDFRIFKGRVANADFENVGTLTEVAFYHRDTRTLLLTDAVIYVPQTAPEVVPRPQLTTAGSLPWYVRVLYGGGADTKERIQQAALRAGRLRGAPRGSDDGTMRLGWQRMALLVLCLRPQNLLDPNDAFATFANRLTISPVVERLVFAKVPEAVAEWVEDMCRSWDFQRIIPCHMAAPIAATPDDLRQTFRFAYEAAGMKAERSPPSLLARLFGGVSGSRKQQAAAGAATEVNDRGFPDGDTEFLRGLSKNLSGLGLTLPDKA